MMNKQNSNGKLIELRPSQEQLKVISSELSEDQKIIACAGSGKTTTLVIRMKYLIDNGVPPEQILVSTFNVEAGQNLKKRAKEIIGPISALIEIGNIDKIAYNYYQKYIKQQNCNLKLSVKEFCYWLQKYLETQEGIDNIISKFKYFFFDEFQDVNQLQYDILMLFKKHGCTIVVIGDDAQNIYSWRDSKIELIQHVIDKDILRITNKNIQTYMLSTNYRCSKYITMFSNQIIASSKYLIKKQMKYKKQQLGQEAKKPTLKVYEGLNHQINSIIDEIKHLMKDTSLNDIAILSPKKMPLRIIEERLEQNNQNLLDNIPYQSRYASSYDMYNKKTNDLNGKQKLTLSTLHNAKGLEWKKVFFIGLNDTFFPGKCKKGSTDNRIEECRRLFYVGCTRAVDELYLSLAKLPNNNQPMVCRFFNDINSEYYDKDKSISKKDFVKNDESTFFKPLRVQNHITKIIDQLNHIELEQVDRFLTNINKFQDQDIHKKTNFKSQKIMDDRLSIDLGLYLDLLLQRSIAEEFNDENGYQYNHAQTVLFPMNWSNEKSEIVSKYSDFFQDKSIQFTNIENSEDFIEILELHYEKDKKKIELQDNEKYILANIYDEIKRFLSKHQIGYKQVFYRNSKLIKFIFQLSKSNITHLLIEGKKDRSIEYFPQDINNSQHIESYRKFCNPKFKTESILKEIHKVSQCGQLINQIRRCLYRKGDFDVLNPNNLKQNIKSLLKHLRDMNFKNIKVKKTVSDGYISGEIDFIADDTIFEIKASQSQIISKEYILQALAYAALIRKIGKQQVNSIAFYNPILGNVVYYDINKWNLQEEYAKFLYVSSLQKSQAQLQLIQQNSCREQEEEIEEELKYNSGDIKIEGDFQLQQQILIGQQQDLIIIEDDEQENNEQSKKSDEQTIQDIQKELMEQSQFLLMKLSSDNVQLNKSQQHLLSSFFTQSLNLLSQQEKMNMENSNIFQSSKDIDNLFGLVKRESSKNFITQYNPVLDRFVDSLEVDSCDDEFDDDKEDDNCDQKQDNKTKDLEDLEKEEELSKNQQNIDEDIQKQKPISNVIDPEEEVDSVNFQNKNRVQLRQSFQMEEEENKFNESKIQQEEKEQQYHSQNNLVQEDNNQMDIEQPIQQSEKQDQEIEESDQVTINSEPQEEYPTTPISKSLYNIDGSYIEEQKLIKDSAERCIKNDFNSQYNQINQYFKQTPTVKKWNNQANNTIDSPQQLQNLQSSLNQNANQPKQILFDDERDTFKDFNKNNKDNMNPRLVSQEIYTQKIMEYKIGDTFDFKQQINSKENENNLIEFYNKEDNNINGNISSKNNEFLDLNQVNLQKTIDQSKCKQVQMESFNNLIQEKNSGQEQESISKTFPQFQQLQSKEKNSELVYQLKNQDQSRTNVKNQTSLKQLQPIQMNQNVQINYQKGVDQSREVIIRSNEDFDDNIVQLEKKLDPCSNNQDHNLIVIYSQDQYQNENEKVEPIMIYSSDNNSSSLFQNLNTNKKIQSQQDNKSIPNGNNLLSKEHTSINNKNDPILIYSQSEVNPNIHNILAKENTSINNKNDPIMIYSQSEVIPNKVNLLPKEHTSINNKYDPIMIYSQSELIEKDTQSIVVIDETLPKKNQFEDQYDNKSIPNRVNLLSKEHTSINNKHDLIMIYSQSEVIPNMHNLLSKDHTSINHKHDPIMIYSQSEVIDKISQSIGIIDETLPNKNQLEDHQINQIHTSTSNLSFNLQQNGGNESSQNRIKESLLIKKNQNKQIKNQKEVDKFNEIIVRSNEEIDKMELVQTQVPIINCENNINKGEINPQSQSINNKQKEQNLPLIINRQDNSSNGEYQVSSSIDKISSHDNLNIQNANSLQFKEPISTYHKQENLKQTQSKKVNNQTYFNAINYDSLSNQNQFNDFEINYTYSIPLLCNPNYSVSNDNNTSKIPSFIQKVNIDNLKEQNVDNEQIQILTQVDLDIQDAQDEILITQRDRQEIMEVEGDPLNLQTRIDLDEIQQNPLTYIENTNEVRTNMDCKNVNLLEVDILKNESMIENINKKIYENSKISNNKRKSEITIHQIEKEIEEEAQNKNPKTKKKLKIEQNYDISYTVFNQIKELAQLLIIIVIMFLLLRNPKHR